MSDAHHGSCLCGAVRFEVRLEGGGFDHFFLCHCSHCRKDTGSAHAANLFSTSATLAWLAGEERVTSFELAGTRHARSFCATCGSALPRLQAQPQTGGALLCVPAGSLDSPLTQRPNAHLFVASRAAWDHELETLPKIQQLPT